MTLPESTPFHAYVEPARAAGAWWRVVLGLAIIGGVWVGFGSGLIVLAQERAFAFAGIGPEDLGALAGSGRVMTPPGVMLFLLTFIGIWLGLWVAVRLIHRRPFDTLFRPGRRLHVRNAMRGAGLALAFYGISMVVYLAVLGPPERTGLPLSAWAPWVVPIALGVVMQATSEELLFRGYILQNFAAWSYNPVIWAILPSLAFAALHYDPSMDAGMRWRMLLHILIFGLIAAAMVWRTGGLGAAVGLHVTNNLFAIGGAGVEGAALGFELWTFPADTLERMFVFDLSLGLLMLAGVFILFGPERRI